MNTINRHNYEEFFMLYMDNELGREDRRKVEDFVQNNPELKEELDLLLHYKLSPDKTIVFPNKEELMRSNNNAAINTTNYEEWLTLYIDNELTIEQKITVEQFIRDNPSVNKELSLLQKTKLQPEEIIFTDKQTLYRKEEKGRVIPVRWWRAAAAILILVGGAVTFIVLINKHSVGKSDVATKTNTEKIKSDKKLPVQKNNPIVAVKEQHTPVNTITVPDNKKEDIAPAYTQAVNPVAVRKITPVTDNKTPQNLPVSIRNNEPVIANNNKPSNNLPQPLNNNVNSVLKEEIARVNVAEENNKAQNPLIPPVVTSPTAKTSDIVTASFNPDDEGGKKQSKLRGFFRKITRTFQKRTNIDPTDDDKLLVGGLAFNLK